jgi:glucose/arabinose dehydrogenase
MSRTFRWMTGIVVLMFVCTLASVAVSQGAAAQGTGPEMLDPALGVRTAVEGLSQPTSLAFLGKDDLLVLERASGKVQRVVDGAVQGTALDLAVNSASERGLLGIALHPRFPKTPWVYLFWTESTTGADTAVLNETPLLGNRVDRFTWDGATLTFDRNIIRLRALQEDATNPVARGNHDGGVIRFGPDRKLYIYMGDNGRRGQMQNLPDGPGCVTATPCPAIPEGGLADDQFGGPEPDDAHLTGVILRLNDDGTTPRSNPFFKAGALRGGEAGTNLQKVFAYGIRNGFGMAFDPVSGGLWEAQNGDDTFTELNRVEAGSNLGWVQVMGPLDRIGQYKGIETSPDADPLLNSPYFGLQQVRWSPVNIANTPDEALARLFHVFEGGDEFEAELTGGEEVPVVATTASAEAEFELTKDGRIEYELEATGDITDATQAHIHLGARGQNGPVVAFLFGFNPAGVDFRDGDLIARGTIDDDDVIARPGFDGTVATLVERMRQGRTYANLHSIIYPGGEVRGQVVLDDKKPVSRYSDPEFSWKFEVAPAALGFVDGKRLGKEFAGDLFVGGARTFLENGPLFRFDLSKNRRNVATTDPRLEDRVADNTFKFDVTESESLLIGRNFGIATDIQTGPNGNLFVVSLSNGAIYEIFRIGGDGNDDGGDDDDEEDDHEARDEDN